MTIDCNCSVCQAYLLGRQHMREEIREAVVPLVECVSPVLMTLQTNTSIKLLSEVIRRVTIEE